MSSPPALRIVVADDHALFRQGLKSLLKLQSEVSVVAEVDRAADVKAILDKTPCDVLLLDLQMERSALADIAQLAPRVRIVVVTATEQPGDAIAALRAGARAVVFKRFAVETLMQAIRAVANGQLWMPASLQADVAARALDQELQPLSSRENEVVRFVGVGLRNAEIAERLGITEATVKTHLNNVFRKVKVRDRVELARYAIRAGLVGLNDP